jgi:hypothetical protein
MKRLLVPLLLVAGLLAATPELTAVAGTSGLRQRVADRIGDTRRLSQGARAWIEGPSTPSGQSRLAATPTFGTNVDANDPDQDLLAGQSETAIAASGTNVLVAWNDVTGFAFTDSTELRASVTGIGFSGDGAAHFRDLLGLPNNNPSQQWSGDPTVVSIDARHFIVGSLYFPSFFTACSDGNPAGLNLGISVGTINSAGTGVSFSDPIVVADGGNICVREPGQALLDKPFLAYDRTSRTLAMSYTRFFLGRRRSGLGQIEVARAHVPASPVQLTTASFQRAVIWEEEQFCTNGSEVNQCGAVNQGSYPAVAPGGDVYVAWERNIESNLFFSGDPYVYIHAALVPAARHHATVGGRADPIVVTEGQRNSNAAGGVKSLDGTAIAGYSRGIGQDFPRVAWHASLRRLVVVWNDASTHPLGDIWMRTLRDRLRTSTPIRMVNDTGDYTLHFMPAVSVRSNGTVCTSWYDRGLGGPDSTRTDYFGECRRSPADASPDFRITTGSTDWAGTSSLINPNFGDYTDNTSTGNRTYFTWADGRLGIPQPFVDSRG